MKERGKKTKPAIKPFYKERQRIYDRQKEPSSKFPQTFPADQGEEMGNGSGIHVERVTHLQPVTCDLGTTDRWIQGVHRMPYRHLPSHIP